MTQKKQAVIIGAGPAGLTAAYELLTRAGIRPVVLEQGDYMGGISRTHNYKGNRMDIGGHRFFSKSDRVMQWWRRILPVAENGRPDAAVEDRVMLLRPRKSRIYYLRRFFDYPISLSKDTIVKLGLWRMARIGLSYMRSVVVPRKNEATLEDFFINRFGRELYRTFFKSYTEKVWGVPCDRISAEWGAQRIKGLSILEALRHALKKIFSSGRSGNISQKNTETSLIEQFLYPKFGPGQMWEEVARQVREMGGEIRTGYKADRIVTDGWKVTAVEATGADGSKVRMEGDYFFSTAPIQEIMRAFASAPPDDVLAVSDGLVYRDFMTVGLLLDSLKIHDQTPQGKKLISDNWIYIQEPDVQLGRLQIFNNWSPYMVKDPSKVWVGLEYFCNDTDALWKISDREMMDLAVKELAQIGIIDAGAVLDSTILRVPKTYPAYFGTYDRFGAIREFVNRYENLFLIGRNGMHRYNNQDHSMLTAMVAVDNIVERRTDKSNLWEVNTEQEYHEGREDAGKGRAGAAGA